MSTQTETTTAWSVSETHLNGLVVGATAFLVEFALALTFTVADGVRTVYDVGGLGTTEVPFWKLGGFLLFGAHDVELSTVAYADGLLVYRRTGTAIGGETAIAGATSVVPAAVYYAVPVVVLLAAGYHVASQVEAPGGLRSAVAGTSVVGGYTPLALLGLVLFRHSETVVDATGTSGSVVFAYDGFAGMAVAFGAYPLVLGAVGGAGVALVAAVRGE